MAFLGKPRKSEHHTRRLMWVYSRRANPLIMYSRRMRHGCNYVMGSQMLTPGRATLAHKCSRAVSVFFKRWQKFCPKKFRRDGSLLSHLKNLHSFYLVGYTATCTSRSSMTLPKKLSSPPHRTYTAS